jgi:hypothetical protein
MRILVACEFSGIVRNAFTALGHDATSCDLLPSETDGKHIVGDVREILGNGWDLMVAHLPCTHLAVSGSRWFKEKGKEQEEALEFVRSLMDAPITKIAIENPISIISSRIRKPDQIVQPWQFGHPEVKATCFWLKNLAPLMPACDNEENLFMSKAPTERTPRVHREPPGPNRWKNRSRTMIGIAKAMAEQWA